MEDQALYKKFGLVLFVGILLVGIGVGVYLTTQRQNIRSRASEGTLSVISPKAQETISQITAIEARVNSTLDPANLYAIYKIDDLSPNRMEISKTPSGSLILEADFNPSTVRAGKHTLTIFLYTKDGSKVLNNALIEITTK